jgi:hypothetical protein
MNELYAFLESKGLLSETQVSRIESMSDREIAKLYEGVYRIIFQAQQRRLADEDTESSEKNPFTFFAGSSLRADSGCG